ncbi:hypothetical protein [Pantoea anthophila]|nr:hypothetical protein [Pantoea anthophila]
MQRKDVIPVVAGAVVAETIGSSVISEATGSKFGDKLKDEGGNK